MALVIADRVRETTSSAGTGTLTLTGAFSGFQPFSVIGNGNTTYYCIIDAAAGAWEVGIGTYTSSGNTLSRDTVLSSSNADALVPFAVGLKDVICTQPAERAVYARAAGTGLAVGATAFTANGVSYADSTSTLATSANMTFNGTRLTVADLADSGLTSGRVTYAGVGGNLVDSANMTFNGTRLTVADLADSGLTSGRVTYASTGGALVDSANLTFDGTTLTPNALTVTNAVTINGGTANGVAYLNGSKVLTTGSALTFDGSNLGLGVTPSAWLSTTKALQLPTGSLFSPNNGSLALAANVYTDGTFTNRYVANNFATYHDQTNGTYRWFTAPSGTAGNAISFTQAMTLDASGRLNIGTTASTATLSIRPSSDAPNTVQLLGDGNVVYGSLGFDSHTGGGGNFRVASNNAMTFLTNGSERARIDSSGNLLVGTTSGSTHILLKGVDSTPSLIARNNQSSGTLFGINSNFSGSAPNNTTSFFLQCNDTGAERCTIRSNGGIANFQGNNVNLSDRREKTNFVPAKSYLETICAIPVQTFNYIDQNMEEDGGVTLGVVAQDVQAVAPELVMESNWGTPEEPKMRLSIYQTDLQYALMKCIQEQQAIITALTARIESLESK